MIIYLVKSTVTIAIMFLIYLLLLEREKMHTFNRSYLLFGIVFAVLIPFIPSGRVIDFTRAAIEVPIFTDGSNGPNAQELLVGINAISWTYMLWIGYLLVAVMIMTISGWHMYNLLSKVRRFPNVDYHGATIVLLPESTLPHTFMKYIFVSESDYHAGAIDERLLFHELAHAEQGHSWDIIFMELMKSIFWFNPMLLWYKKAIQLNHEFLADDSVVVKYKNTKAYQN